MTTETQNSRFRYRIFTMVVLLALINYIDRGAMSYAAAHITGEYGLDRGDWGSVLGYFGYGYMVGALFGGMLADRYGPRKVWIVAGVTWSVFEIATAWAGDFGLAFLGGSALAGFATIRILFGADEGPAYSIINKTIANWATPRERGFVVGFGLLSTPLGALLTAPVAVGLLSLTGSWRAMFYILGGAGQSCWCSSCASSPTARKPIRACRPPSCARSSRPASRPPPARPWTARAAVVELLPQQDADAQHAGLFLVHVRELPAVDLDPKYLQDNFGYSLSSLWYMGMIPWTGACVTVLLGGRISDLLLKRTGSLKIARSWFAAGCLLATALCFMLVSQAQSVFAVIALMTLANALNALPNSVYWAVVIDTAPASRVGTFSGLMHFFANIASILAPTLTGYLAARHGYSVMFVAASIATAIGMIAMLQVRPGVAPRLPAGAAQTGAAR